jgi:AAA15 family ATPase/GTPase
MIKHVTIKNFKGINSLEITPKKFNVLVGRNNTGKTSILEAISVCMNPNLTQDLFENKYQNSIINYLSDNSSIKIEKEDDKIKKLTIRKAPPDQILKLLKKDLSELYSKKNQVYMNIDKNISIEKIIKDVDKDKIIEASSDSIVILVNYSGRQILLPGKLYEELLLDALNKVDNIYKQKKAKDSRNGGSEGNIIEDVFENVNMFSLLRHFNKSLNKNLFVKGQKNNVTFIKDTLNSYKSIKTSETRALQLENIIKDDNIISNLKRFNFNSLVLDTEDGRKEIPIESMGDGFKSLIYILTNLYENESNIILMEEPENYMHPGYISELIHYIISIANNSQTQLFITTHSQDFLYMLTSNDALPENDREFLKKELLILQLSKWKDDIILSNLDYNDSVSDMENLLLDLRGI